MTEEERQKQIEDAGIEYTITNKPRCVAGDNFADLARQLNKNLDFEAGAKWSDKHPVNYDGKALLYVCNKSHENGYKEAVDKACKWLGGNFRVSSFDDTKIVTHFSSMFDVLASFRKAMKREMVEDKDKDND